MGTFIKAAVLTLVGAGRMLRLNIWCLPLRHIKIVVPKPFYVDDPCPYAHFSGKVLYMLRT